MNPLIIYFIIAIIGVIGYVLHTIVDYYTNYKKPPVQRKDFEKDKPITIDEEADIIEGKAEQDIDLMRKQSRNRPDIIEIPQ